MGKQEIKKGRFISNKKFLDSIDKGDLNNLFVYLSKNKEKYNLTIRDNKITLYSFGRKLDIKCVNNNYQLVFDLNNADKLEIDKLDAIIEFIKKYNFDISKYDYWKINHKNNNKVKAIIPCSEIQNYKFEEVLNKLSIIFESYKDERKEEAFKQEFTYMYDNLRNDYIVFDTEYVHSFDTQAEKDKAKKTVKSDLIALKKVKDKYKVIFIELKENISASVGGFSSNIGEHILDTLNFKNLYTTNEKEKKRFKKYVKFNLRFKVNHNLLDIDDVENVIKNIDFNDAPDIMIVCGFETETKEQLKKSLKNKFDKHNKYAGYIEWNNIIIVGKKDPEILLQNGIPINEFLKGE